MKMRLLLLLLIASMGLSDAIAASKEYEIEFTAAPKRFDRDAKDAGNTTVVEEKHGYTITAKNKAFKDTPPFEIKYILFYTEAKAGSTAAPVIKQQKGSHSVNGLARFGSVQFDTSAVNLKKVQLDANWSYGTGANRTAKDTVKGIWIRAYLDGNVIGEYSNPTTLSKSQEWKD